MHSNKEASAPSLVGPVLRVVTCHGDILEGRSSWGTEEDEAKILGRRVCPLLVRNIPDFHLFRVLHTF